MDKDWQDTLFEGWVDFDVILSRRKSDDIRTDGPPVETSNHSARHNENESLAIEDPNTETGVLTEPPKFQPQTPLKKRPALTHPSVGIFHSSVIDDDDDDDDDGKSKQSRASVGDNNSVFTIDNNDERRLSDRVIKAWRGVTGQRLADPLEQWMVKHSGGTLRDAPVRRPFSEYSN